MLGLKLNHVSKRGPWILKSGSWNHKVVNKQNVQCESGFLITNAKCRSSFNQDVEMYQFYPNEFYQMSLLCFQSFFYFQIMERFEMYLMVFAYCTVSAGTLHWSYPQRHNTRSCKKLIILSIRIKVCAGACWTCLLPPQLLVGTALAFEWAVKVAITAIGFSWVLRSMSFWKERSNLLFTILPNVLPC